MFLVHILRSDLISTKCSTDRRTRANSRVRNRRRMRWGFEAKDRLLKSHDAASVVRLKTFRLLPQRAAAIECLALVFVCCTARGARVEVPKSGVFCVVAARVVDLSGCVSSPFSYPASPRSSPSSCSGHPPFSHLIGTSPSACCTVWTPSMLVATVVGLDRLLCRACCRSRLVLMSLCVLANLVRLPANVIEGTVRRITRSASIQC
jgi:hypothetical protein